MTRADAIAQKFEEILNDAEDPPDGLVIYRQNRRPKTVDRVTKAINIFKVKEHVEEVGGLRRRRVALRIRLRLIVGDTEDADSTLESLREFAVAAINAGRGEFASIAHEVFESDTDWDGESDEEADYEFADVEFIARYETTRGVC
jgi:hypothetical protein